MTNAQHLSSPSLVGRRHRRRGEMSPLVALALAGGIAAIIAVGVAAYGDDTRTKASADIEYDKLVAIKNKVIRTFGTRYINLGQPTAAQFAQSGLAPASMVVGNTVVNGRNGAVSLSGSFIEFWLTSSNITLDDCLTIAGRFGDDPSARLFARDSQEAVSGPFSGDGLTNLCGTSGSRNLSILFQP